MGVRSLAEAIILQSMNDLYSSYHRPESLKFFARQEFVICAEMAGMDTDTQIELLQTVREMSNAALPMAESIRIRTKAGRVTTSPRALPAPSQ